MSFKNTFIACFESAEIVEHAETNGVTLDHVEQIHVDREITEEQLESPVNFQKELKDVNQVRSALVGAVDAVKHVSELSPAYVEPAVEIANQQLSETAQQLGIDAPAPLVINQDTLEIDEPSMEGVLDWLGRALSAFGAAIKKSWHRFRISMQRFGNLSTALTRRTARCYSLLPRRKHPEGGNPIKVKPKYLEPLVLHSALTTDPIGELNRTGEVLASAYSIYTPVIGEIENSLGQTLAAVVAFNGHYNQVQAKTDVTPIVEQLAAIQKKGEMYMGNHQITLKPSKALLPALAFEKGKPGADFIVRSLPMVPSLSDETIRSWLLGVAQQVDARMSGLENILEDIGVKCDNLIRAVSRVNVHNHQPIQLAQNNAIAAAQVVAKGVQLFNAVELSKLESRVEDELGTIWTVLSDLHDVYFEQASAIIAYIEESLMQD